MDNKREKAAKGRYIRKWDTKHKVYKLRNRTVGSTQPKPQPAKKARKERDGTHTTTRTVTVCTVTVTRSVTVTQTAHTPTWSVPVRQVSQISDNAPQQCRVHHAAYTETPQMYTETPQMYTETLQMYTETPQMDTEEWIKSVINLDWQ